MLIVGSIIEGKGHEHTIKAIQYLRKKGYNVDLYIAGKTKGKFYQQMFDLSHKLGVFDHVHFLGHVKDMNKLKREMCVEIIASRCEAFGRITIEAIWSVSQRLIIEIEKIIGVDRTIYYSGQFKSGSQWWSIKTDLARYITSQRYLIRKLFKYTMCDEMFVQTLTYNSKFYDTVYIKDGGIESNQRLIVFKRGAYTWTIKDIEDIKKCGLLFARKFDDKIDSEVISEIIKICKNNAVK